MTTDATRAKTARARRNRAFPLRVRLQRGQVVHAAGTHGLYVDGAGMTACSVQYEPGDEQLGAETPVTCKGCKGRRSVREVAEAA